MLLSFGVAPTVLPADPTRFLGADVVTDAGGGWREMCAVVRAGRPEEPDRRDVLAGGVQRGSVADGQSALSRAAIRRMVSFSRSEASPVSMM